MAQSTTVVSLPQMIDLALNTPEVGIVNFTVLHSLLHVIVSQLSMNDIKVEFRGQDSERIQNFVASAVSPNKTLILSQYTIEAAEKGKDKEVGEEKNEETYKIKDMEKDKSQTVVLVENSGGTVGGGQFTVAVSKTHFDNLEQEVEDLKKVIRQWTDLPSSQTIMDAVKKGDSSPVLDMFQMINLQKRIAGVESILEKLGTMFEDFVKVTGQEGVVGTDALNEMHHMKEALGEVTEAEANNTTPQTRTTEHRGSAASGGRRPSKSSGSSVSTGLANLVERVAALEELVGQKKSIVSETLTDGSETEGDKSGTQIAAQPQRGSLGDVIEHIQTQIQTLDENATHLLKDMADIKFIMNANVDSQPLDLRVKMLESKYNDTMETLNSLDGGYKRQVTTLQNRLGDLEKQVGAILEKGNVSSDESGKMDSNITAELHKQLMALQDEVSTLAEQTQKIMEEHENRQQSLEVLIEQIELLKTVKADREDLEDALADKADACLINRKVSFEQFDQACGDMTRSIEEALAKLSQQEGLWSQALDDIQKNVGSKLDRVELNPLRDFINQKLKSLQDRFKTLTALKKENEAAGTKSRLLRNVNCISCDKDVVMRKEMDPSLYPKPYTLPPTRSMGPYLAYELDQLRKQQKCLPNSKNMNILENALQASKVARSPDHICNRYCGGSHTLTNPTQRVSRVGHFLDQWGPEIAPVNDNQVRGTDGHMYKARDNQALRQLASEKPPSPHPDQKPAITITRVAEDDMQPDSNRESKDRPSVDRSKQSKASNALEPGTNKVPSTARRLSEAKKFSENQ